MSKAVHHRDFVIVLLVMYHRPCGIRDRKELHMQLNLIGSVIQTAAGQ